MASIDKQGMLQASLCAGNRQNQNWSKQGGVFHGTENGTRWCLLIDLQKHKILSVFPNILVQRKQEQETRGREKPWEKRDKELNNAGNYGKHLRERDRQGRGTGRERDRKGGNSNKL